MPRLLKTILFSVLFLCLSACNTNPTFGLLVTKGEKDKEIAALRVQHAADMEKLTAEAQAKTQQILTANLVQKQTAAASFYGQDVVFRSIVAPTRTDLIVHNLALEGWAALGVQPTYEDMKIMNERLIKELDETKTSLIQLQANHNAALAKNEALAAATKKFEDELKEIQRKIDAKEKEFRASLDAKQSEIIDLNNKIIAAQDAKRLADERRAAMIAKLSWGSGIVAALCVLGAIFSPVFKRELGISAVTFGAAAAALPFLEPWHVAAGIGLVFLIIIVWVAIKYRREEKLADALVLANQDIKEKAPEVWAATARPIVEDRLSKYKKDWKSGKISTVKDKGLEKHIDAKLAEYDALPSKPKS